MIIGSILGFAGSVLPGIFKLLQNKQDNKQELAVMAAQVALQTLDNQQKIDMSVLSMEENSHKVAVNADMQAGQRQGQTCLGKWLLDMVAVWRAAMRPWMVSVLVCFYVWVKYQIVTAAIVTIEVWTVETVASSGIWTPVDMELLFLGVTFYLGKRGMEKMQGGS